jgi:hypothetical protein
MLWWSKGRVVIRSRSVINIRVVFVQYTRYLSADHVQHGLESQLGLWPLALGDNRHNSRPHPARCLFESLVRRALFVVKVVIAVIFED